MRAQINSRCREQCIVKISAILLVSLLYGAGGWSQEILQHALHPRTVKAGSAQVSVHQGRLSVDIQQVDIGDVLRQIAAQADIRILYSARSGKRISATFTDVELEKGLQRLLRLVSLNYAITYAQQPSGDVAIQEVRVFDVEGGENSQQASKPTDVEPAPGEPVEQTVQTEPPSGENDRKAVDLLARHLSTAPQIAGPEQQELIQRFLEAVGVNNEGTEASPPTPDPSVFEREGEDPEIPTDAPH